MVEEAVLSVVDGKVATLSVAVVKVAVLEDGGGKVAVVRFSSLASLRGGDLRTEAFTGTSDH